MLYRWLMFVHIFGAILFFMGHGATDPVVPIHLAEGTVEKLRANGYKPEWHSYAMPHSVAPQEVQDMGNWLRPLISA